MSKNAFLDRIAVHPGSVGLFGPGPVHRVQLEWRRADGVAAGFRAVACRADEEGYAFKRRKYIGKGGKVISLPMIYDVRCWKCVSAARSGWTALLSDVG